MKNLDIDKKYKELVSSWILDQKKGGSNKHPGEGTRNRLKRKAEDLIKINVIDTNIQSGKIIEVFDRIKKASIEINRMHEDIDFLCDNLNKVDISKIIEYYRSDKSGPVIDLRKDVCKEIMLMGKILSDRLLEIISTHRIGKESQLKSWKNPYKIIHPLINYQYRDIDLDTNKLIEEIIEKIGFEVGTHFVNFDGAMQMGTDQYWIAFYPIGTNKSKIQIFINCKNGIVTYGIYSHDESKYYQGPFDLDDKIYQFIDDNKHILKSTVRENGSNLDGTYTFLEAAKLSLKECNNVPMASDEIYKKICDLGLKLNSSGKTPVATLNTKLLYYTINSNSSARSKSPIFESVGQHPMKFKLIKHVPNQIKESLIDDGFIHISKLKEILESEEFIKLLKSKLNI